MKRNLILLAIILICSIILVAISPKDNNGRLNTVGDRFEKYGTAELTADKKYPRTTKFRELNLENDEDPDLFNLYIEGILESLEIEYQNTKLPNSKDKIGNYRYSEYGLKLTCSFEKFTQFVIEFEISFKIFIFTVIIVANNNFRNQTLDKEFEIKIKAVDLKKKGKK